MVYRRVLILAERWRGMQRVIKHFFTRQFLLFIAVGISAAFINWLSRLLLNNWISFSLAVFFSYGIGMTMAFILNSHFVFPMSDKPKIKQARDFLITNSCCFPIVWIAAVLLNHLLESTFNISNAEEISHAIALGIPMLASFLIYKFFIFKESNLGEQ